jgi:hypothetical protein
MYHYRCQNVYISATASERIVDTLQFLPHNYQMPQSSSTDRLIMAANDMTYTLKNPYPKVPFTHVGDDTISALTALAEIFKLKLQKVHTPALPAAPPKVTQRTCNAESSNPILASPMPPPHQNNSRSRHKQRAITSEGGHTNDASSITSEGANALTKSLSPQLVPRRLLRHVHCSHGHSPWKSPLVPEAPSQCSRSTNHRKINGIHGTYERPPSTTTLETRLWQRGRAPFSRHSRHSWHRHMFLHQTH